MPPQHQEPPPRNDQSIKAIPDVRETVGHVDLDSTPRPDRSRAGGQDNKLVGGFVGSPEPLQTEVRPGERGERSTHIADFTIRIDQESDPAETGDLCRCSTWGESVHGANFYHDLDSFHDRAVEMPTRMCENW
jgi:hypothetical protein